MSQDVELTNTSAADKRETVRLFQQRLIEAIERRRLSRRHLAQAAGVDRSTLSQLLARDAVRLPRAETVVALARALGVSLDWLMGLSAEAGESADVLEAKPEIALRPRTPLPADDHLIRWHQEATGYKIRFVPSNLPDFAKTGAVLEFEYAAEATKTPDQAIAASRNRLEYMRMPETDMEVCIEQQQLEVFAAGRGIWAGLSVEARIEQLEYMAKLLDDLYPGLRVYAYDGHTHYSAPFTVFGPLRVAHYLGSMYLVFTNTEHVRLMSRHFDSLIRVAVTHAHDMSACLRDIAARTR